MRFHHTGVACRDIADTLAKVKKLFPVKSHSDTIFDPDQNAELCLVELEGAPAIELVSGAVVAGYLAKEVFQYHMCYEVESLDKEIERFYQLGSLVVSPPKPAVLFNNRRVAFIFTPVGLVEILKSELK